MFFGSRLSGLGGWLVLAPCVPLNPQLSFCENWRVHQPGRQEAAATGEHTSWGRSSPDPGPSGWKVRTAGVGSLQGRWRRWHVEARVILTAVPSWRESLVQAPGGDKPGEPWSASCSPQEGTPQEPGQRWLMGPGWGGDSGGGQLVHNTGSRRDSVGPWSPLVQSPGPSAGSLVLCQAGRALAGCEQFQLVTLASATSARCH